MPLSDYIETGDEKSSPEKEEGKSIFDVPIEDQSVSQIEADRAKTNIELSQDSNPDEEAKILDISKRSGFEKNLIREDEEGAIEKQVNAQEDKEVAAQNPGLSKYLTNVDNAALSKDDIAALADVENVVGLLPEIMAYEPSDVDPIRGSVGTVKSLFKQAGRFPYSMAKFALDTWAWGMGTLEATAKGIEDVTGFERGGMFGESEQLALGVSETVKQYLATNPILNLDEEKQGRLWDNPQYLLDPEWMAFNVGEVAQSFIPVIGATLVGGPVAGAAVGATMEGSDLYSGLREQGVSEENASTAALAFGVVVGFLNKLSLDRILKKVPAGNTLNRMMHRVVTGTVEATTEYGEEPFQAAFGEIAKGSDMPTILAAVAESLKNVEVIPGSFLMGGGMNTTISQANINIQAAKHFVQAQDEINVAVNKTKTKDRAPEKIKEFLDTAGLGEEVFIAPEGIRTLFQEDPKKAEELLERIGVDPEIALEEAQTGQPVRVETSSLQAFLSPEEYAKIREDLKPAPGAFTQRETANQEAIDDMARLIDVYAEATKDDIVFQEELNRIREQVTEAVEGLEQFKDTNIEEYTEAYVQKIEAFANRMALEGRDRVDFLKKMGFVTPSTPISFLDIGKTFQQVAPDDPILDTVKQVNTAKPGHAIRYDGFITLKNGSNLYHFTAYDGPAARGTFTTYGTSAEEIQEGLDIIVERFKKFYQEEPPVFNVYNQHGAFVTTATDEASAVNLAIQHKGRYDRASSERALAIVSTPPYTLKILKDPLFVKVEKDVEVKTIKKVANQKSTAKIERELVETVLASDMFKGKESINFAQFKTVLEGLLLPLDPIPTSQNAPMGATNIRMTYDTATAIVYNTPVDHGVMGGHFDDRIFQDVEKVEYEVIELTHMPGVFLAMDKNRPQLPVTTDEAILQEYQNTYMGSVGSKAETEAWIKEYEAREPGEHIAGMLGSVRRWDKEEIIRYIAEIQSDFFQKRNAETVISSLVLADPKTKKQRELSEEYDKANDTIENAPQVVVKAYRRARRLLDWINDTKEIVKRNQKEIKRKKQAMEREGTPFLATDVTSPLNLLDAEAEIKAAIIDQNRYKLELESIPEGSTLAEIKNYEVVRTNRDGVEEVIHTTSDRIEAQALADRYQREADDYEPGMAFRVDEKIIERASTTEIEAFKGLYEDHVSAQIEKHNILTKEIPKTFNILQKQFVAHRKNYLERMLKEEIREAAIDGKKYILIPTPRTTAFIQGFRQAPQRQYVEDQMDFGMYEVTSGDPDNLELGDLIDYAGDEYTVITTDNDTIEVVNSQNLNQWSIDDYIRDQLDSAWEDTLYEMPDEFEIKVTVLQDERQLLLPGFLRQEQPPGFELHREGRIVYTTETFDVEDWWGQIGYEDVASVLKRVIEDDIQDYEVNEEGIIDIPMGDIDDRLYSILETMMDDQYYNADEIEYSLEGMGYETVSVDMESNTIYTSSDSTEVFPQPHAIQQELMEEGLEDEEVDIPDAEAVEPAFDINELATQHQTIVKKYEELDKLLKKLLPETYEMVQDDQGFWWHRAEVPEEKANEPVELFQSQEVGKRGSVTITDEGYLINLFNNANLSTLPHETGHIFLEEMRLVVEAGEGSTQFTKDYQTVLKWLGSDGGELTTEQHEKFARGFEIYLLEGKAPSLELEGIFSRFRRWLTEVYKTAKSLQEQYGIKLTKEVREVFDRLLIVQEEVDQTAKAYGVTFRSEAELNALGVIDADQAYMKRLEDEARLEAEAKMIKDRNRSRKQNLAKWKAEAERFITATPAFQVIETLSKFKGLDKETVAEEYGSDILEKMPSHWYRKDGLDPNEVALAAGYPDALTMLRSILEMPSKQEAIDQFVADKQLQNDIRYKADDYIVNTEAYSDYLTILGRYYEGPVRAEAEQVDPLTTTGRPKAPKTISRQAFSNFVRKTLGLKSTRDAIRHDRYLASMKKAQNSERKAALKNDMPVAQRANEQARLNYEMAGQAVNNRKLVEKILRNAKQQAKNKNIELQHRENIRSLVERFSLAAGVAPQKPESMTPLSSLIQGNEFVDSFPASDFLLNNTIKDYRDLSFAEMKEVGDLINYLTGKGRDINKAMLADGKTTVEAAAFESAEETFEMKPKKIREKFSVIRKLSDTSRTFFAMLDSLNFIAIAKGGYKNVGKKGVRSKTEEHIIDPIINAQDSKDEMTTEMFDKLQPFLDRIIRTVHDWNEKHGRKMFIPNAPVPVLLQQDGQTGWWSGDQIFAIALNVGNEGNLERLMKGYPDLTRETIDNLLALLEQKDWDAVQGIWDTINSLYEDINNVHVRMNNFHMQKVEATPFNTKFGEYRGGYYPAVFDPKLSNKVAEFTERDDLMARSEAIRQVPSGKSGMTKARQSGVALPLRLSLGVTTSHVNDAIHYITHAEIIRDVDRITRNELFAAETERVLGKEVYEMIRPALKHIARPVRESIDIKTDKAVNWLRNRTTAFFLAWNASVAAKQMFSSPAAAFDMGLIHYVKGFKAVLTNPASNYQLMMELSPYMAQRGKSMDRELQDMFSKMSPDQRASWFGDKAVTWDDVRNFGFWPIRIVDMATVIPIWNGAYNKMMKESDGDLKASVKYADDIVRRTQPSAQPLDLSHWQRVGGVIRLLSSFQTFTVGKYGQRQRLHYRAMRSGKITKAEYAWFNFVEAILPAVGMNLLFAMLWGRDFDDEETWEKIGKEALKYIFLTGVPILGQIFSKYGDPLDSPLAKGPEYVKRAVNDGARYLEEQDDKDLTKLIWDSFHLVSFVSGVPLSRVVEKVNKGLEQDEGYIPGIEYLIPAPKK